MHPAHRTLLFYNSTPHKQTERARLLCAVTVNLNVAVVGFTLLFHAVKIASKKFDAFKGIDLSDLATISLDEDSARV